MTFLSMTQVGTVVYMIPRSLYGELNWIVAVKYSLPSKATVNLSNIYVSIGDHAAIAGCTQSSNTYIFYKFTDPFLYIAQVSPQNLSVLQVIDQIFMNEQIATMAMSSST